jgi:hypothetical protein
MKKLSLFITLTIAYSVARCQLDKGLWLVGGSGSFQSYNRDYQIPPNSVQYKETEVSISPSIGYFIIDKLAVGLRPSFSWSKSEGVGSTGNVSGGIGSNSWLELGPFGRWYFLQKGENYNIVGDASYHYGIQSYFGSETGHSNTFKLLVGPEFYFNSSVGIELLVGYNSRREFYDDGTSNFYKGFLTTIGFQLHLEKN